MLDVERAGVHSHYPRHSDLQGTLWLLLYKKGESPLRRCGVVILPGNFIPGSGRQGFGKRFLELVSRHAENADRRHDLLCIAGSQAIDDLAFEMKPGGRIPS